MNTYEVSHEWRVVINGERFAPKDRDTKEVLAIVDRFMTEFATPRCNDYLTGLFARTVSKVRKVSIVADPVAVRYIITTASPLTSSDILKLNEFVLQLAAGDFGENVAKEVVPVVLYFLGMPRTIRWSGLVVPTKKPSVSYRTPSQCCHRSPFLGGI